MKNKKLKAVIVSLVVLAILLGGLFYLKSAQAYVFGSGDYQVTIDDPAGAFTDLDTSINRVFSLIITISEVAFVLLFLIGGIMYLTSMGDEEASKKAKKLMTDAVIGLVIVLSAWAIGTWVISQLKGKGSSSTTTTNTDETPNQEAPPPQEGAPPGSTEKKPAPALDNVKGNK